jgi:hypothetical protein
VITLERPAHTDVAPAAPRGHRTRWLAAAAVFVGAAALNGYTVVRGRELQRTSPEVFLGAAPLVGRSFRDGWDWRFGWGLMGAGAVAVLVIAAVHTGWVERVRLRTLIASATIAAAVFAVALALTDGIDGVLHGATDPTEYLANLPSAPPAGEFVRTFVDRIDDYSVHVRGHPPGFVVLLQAMHALGLRGAWPVAALSVIGAGAVVAAALTTVWAVAGDTWVRRSAPFVVLTPYALWLVTSADSVYTALGATGVALFALSLRTHGRRAVLLGLAAGLALGALLFGTYLGAVYLVLPSALAVRALRQRRMAATIAAAAGIGIVVLAFLAAGFWWVDGAHRTRVEYWEGTAQFRHWGYFGWSNLAVAIIAVGPAAVAGLVALRDRRMWWLVGGALAALMTSHLSQFTRGEVERIWLLFFPWLAIAGGALVVRACRSRVSAWLGLQAACAIALQAALVSKW